MIGASPELFFGLFVCLFLCCGCFFVVLAFLVVHLLFFFDSVGASADLRRSFFCRLFLFADVVCFVLA